MAFVRVSGENGLDVQAALNAYHTAVRSIDPELEAVKSARTVPQKSPTPPQPDTGHKFSRKACSSLPASRSLSCSRPLRPLRVILPISLLLTYALNPFWPCASLATKAGKRGGRRGASEAGMQSRFCSNRSEHKRKRTQSTSYPEVSVPTGSFLRGPFKKDPIFQGVPRKSRGFRTSTRITMKSIQIAPIEHCTEISRKSKGINDDSLCYPDWKGAGYHKGNKKIHVKQQLTYNT